MAGKGEAGGFPALSAGGVDIKDAEHHRQAFAAVDDPHQVGVLQIVVGQLVARVAILEEDDLVQRARPLGKVARGTLMTRDVTGDQLQMLAITRKVDALALERGEHEGGFGDRQDAPVGRAELA